MRAKVETVMRWYAQDEVDQEESERNEVDGMKKGVDSTGKLMHMWKSGWWFVMRKIRVVKTVHFSYPVNRSKKDRLSRKP